MFAKRFLLVMLLAASTAAIAQPPATPAPQAAEKLTPDQLKQNEKMRAAALEVASMVDQKKLGEIWDGATPAIKKLVTRDAFVSQITTDRKMVGALVSRTMAGLNYAQSDGKSSPAGVYANVTFSSQFANETQPVRELISFHFDDDKLWRVSGYTLR